MRTITKNVYTLNELSPIAKAKALDNNRHYCTEYDDWYSFAIKDWELELATQGFNDAEIDFSGFSSQGDGASFTATVDVQAQLKGRSKALPLLTKLSHLSELIQECTIYRIDRHYSHENTVSIQILLDDERVEATIAEHNRKQFDDEISLLENLIIDDARNEMKKIYKALGAEYDELTSDEHVEESLTINEMEFYENGDNAKE